MFTPSFLYDGVPADLNTWQKTVSGNDNKTITEWISPDETLAVRVTVTTYPGFPVTEMVPELICRGTQPTKIIERFRTLSYAFPREVINSECTVRAVHGSKAVSTDFTARSFILTENPEENTVSFDSAQGRCSFVWMPFFGLDITPRNGWEIAIGWTGAWNIDFTADVNTVKVEAGMTDSRFYMQEGETFRQPGILLFRRENMPVMAFQTVIRDFMIQHKSPRDSKGNVIKPRLPLSGSGGNRPTEYLTRQIDYVSKHGYPIDTFWVDAGWYGPPHSPNPNTNCGDCWFKYVGDWRINPVRHPGGLRPIADKAHEHGIHFLLWFESERVTSGTPIMVEHPEYILTPPVDLGPGCTRCLLDLGKPEAWNWIYNILCKYIEEVGIQVYRQDFNVNPLPIWRHHEEPDRSGVLEIKHIMGLYALWDALRKRFPDLLIDNCASGGSRLDYEMISRSHVYCRSDYFLTPFPDDSPSREYPILAGQNALINTMAYVPFQFGSSNVIHFYSDYELFSVTGTGNAFNFTMWNKKFPMEDESYTPEETAWLHKRSWQVSAIRDILCGKLYWLIPEKTTQRQDIWVAYQGWNEAINKGVATFFRRKESEEAVRTFALQEIDLDARYEVEDYKGGKQVISGKELANWTVRLDEPRSVSVIFYQKVK